MVIVFNRCIVNLTLMFLVVLIHIFRSFEEGEEALSK